MKKNRKERKLTRLVLGALMLGAGTLFAPTAEAKDTVTINSGMSTESSMTAAGMNKMTQSTVNYWRLSDSTRYDKLVINGVHTNWLNYDFAGYARNSNSGVYTPVTVTMNNGRFQHLYGVLLTGTASGTVTKHTVNVTGGTVDKSIVGGESADGDAISNNVTFSNAYVGKNIIGGRSINGHIAKTNTITINSGEAGQIVGGWASQTNCQADGNIVTIKGGKVGHDTVDNDGDVYGGLAEGPSGIAINNEVHISGNTGIQGTVYGGKSTNNSNSNKVFISNSNTGTSNTTGYIYGGYSEQGVANVNNVEITGGTITGEVFGGRAANAATAKMYHAMQNTVTISDDATVKGHVWGGLGGDAGGNTIKITGGTLGAPAATVHIIGGHTDFATNGEASNNTVEVSNGQVYGWIAAGNADQSGTQIVKENTVKISGGTVTETVTGGRAVGTGGTATENAVTISQAEGKTTSITGTIFGGKADSGTVDKNTVTITGGTASGSVQGGQGNTASENKVDISGGTVGAAGADVIGGHSMGGDNTKNTVTISGGTVAGTVYAGYTTSGNAGGADKGNTVQMTGGTVSGTYGLNGGWVETTGNATYNTVTMSGGEVTRSIRGGRSGGENSQASDNNVTISGDAVIDADVMGGRAVGTGADANDNTVTINGGTFSSDSHIYGGYGDGDAIGNTVNINAAINVKGVLVGNAGTSTGNTLNLGAAGITVGTDGISKTQTIKIGYTDAGSTLHTVAFAKDATVLSSTGAITGVDTLDISADAATLAETTTPGTMTLLSGGGVTNFDSLKLKYSSAAAAAIPAGGTKVKETAKTDAKDGVTLGYTNTHTVIRESATTVNYTITNAVNTVTPGQITWNAGGTARSGEGYTFSGTTKFDASNMTFTGTSTVNPMGQSMTLLSNAVGIGTDIDQPGADKGKVAVAYTDAKGVGLNAKAKGDVSRVTNDVKYTIGSVALSSVDLSNWNGTTDAVPTGWTGTGVAVATGNFAAPTDLGVGESRNIFATNTANFFGTVSGDREYKSGTFADDTDKGVTLSGNTFGGVKTTEGGKNLTYYAETMDTTAITLGTMTWGAGRTAEAGYDFRNVGTVTATDLKFDFTDAQKAALSASSKMTLLSGATNLEAGKTVTGTPSQTIDYTTANGAALNGTFTGTVSTAAGAVNYAATTMTLDSVTLSGWNGKESAVPSGWTASDTLSVTGDGFTEPALALGSSMNILTTGTDNYFANASIDPKLVGKELEYSEEAKNISLSGMEVRSVKADGKNLVYASEKANIDAVAIGAVTYDKGATLLDRSGAVYDYSKVSALDTKGFTVTMTDAQAKAAQVNDSMTLLKANATLTDIGAIDAGTAGEYDYTPTAGMNVTAAVQGSVSATGGSVLYSVTGNNASSLNFETVKWDSAYKRTDSEALYTTAMVNTSGVVFTGTDSLATGAEMLLVENYGDSIRKSRGDTFKLGDLTGKGYAYYKDGGLYFHVEKGTSTEPEPAVPVKGQTVPVEEDHIGDVSGGEAKGDGDATGNEVDVKKGVTVEGDVTGGKTEGKGESKDNKVNIDGGTIETGQNGRGGDVTGGKSDEGNTKGNEATVENGSKVDGGVTGGQTEKGDAEGNTATVTGESVIGTEEGGVTGGRTGEGESKGNEATVEGSTVNGDVTGGESGKGGVKENKTNVTNSEVKPNEKYGDASADVTGGRTGEGDATGNETTVEGTKVTSGDVTGGQSEKGDAGGNKTNATDSEIKGNVTGGRTEEGDAGKNETTVDGSTVTGSVTGGETKNGNATENETTVTGSTVTGGDITGGKSGGEGNADENKTGVSSSTVEGGNVTGGSSEKGNADKNETTVEDGTKVTGDVTGGKTEGSGDAKENKTSVNGSTTEITGSVTGGQSKGGNTDKNETSVTGGSQVNGDVTGGSTEGSGTASENKANVEGVSTQVGGDVTGGKTTGSGDAKENKTSVDKSTVGGSVTGGSSESGSTDKNETTVTGGTVNGDVTGGKTTGTGTASENKTSVSGSTVGGDTGDGNVTGGQSEKGSTDKNETSVTGSTVKGSVTGGQTGGEGTASENKATVEDKSTVGGSVTGGQSKGGTADKNEASVTGGSTVKGSVAGGRTTGSGTASENKAKAEGSTVGSTEEDGVIGGATENGKAEGNQASVTGGSTVTGNVAGAISQNGSLEGNTATVEGKSKVTGDVTGGVGETGAVSGNTASVSGESEIKGEVAGGVTGGSGEAKGNKASVEGSTVGSDKAGHSVIGGSSENGKAEGNEASVKGSEVTGGVIGASSAAGEVESNIAAVDGSDIDGSVEGAQTSGKGAASTNQATVGGESTVAGSVTGATTDSGEAKENKASVTGGSTVTKDVKGAVSTSGTVTANEATIDASVVEGSVAGATTAGAGTATLNIAAITNSKITGSVAGATSEQGAVTRNQATVTGGSVGGDILGGYSKEGSASNNTVNVMQTVVGTEEKDGNIYGGKTDGADKPADANNVTLDGGANVIGGVFGGYSENGTADGNIVTIRSATIRDYLYGGKSKSKSSNDEVYFEDGSVLGIIGGGCAEAVNNKAELMDGGVKEHVIGGFASETATGNTVTMTGGTVTGSVIGGYGGTTAADNNTVLLSGGTVKGETITSTALGGVTIEGGVYGGYGNGTTQNNTVNLYGTADVSATGLIGGSREATGNTLNLGYIADGTPSAWTGGGQSVQNISNFETMRFVVAPWDKEKAAITITDGTKSDLSSTTVSAENVSFTGVNSLAQDDTMTLLDQSAVTKKTTSVIEGSNFTAGMSIEGTGALSLDDGGNVVYNVKSVRASSQTHNTVMGAEVAMTALSVGNDFIGDATEGLGLMANTGADGVSAYAKMGGGLLRQDTGSHIDVHTWNAILGLGHKNTKEKSAFEYGAFFEYGSGNYTTHNDAGQRGDGSARYTGGGLLAKWTAHHGLYVEGSLRAGTVHDDARNLLRDAANAYSYETDENYLGFHIGVGKEIEVADGNVVDVYGKYFYNRKNGADFTVNGDAYSLDSVTSSVLRVGARYTMKREKWNFFGGIAYEHELDGKAGGRVNGVSIEGADIGGGSFRGELGATMKPDANSPWSLDLSVAGYAGKKQGVMGGVSVTFAF